jgi:hypothetical protein
MNHAFLMPFIQYKTWAQDDRFLTVFDALIYNRKYGMVTTRFYDLTVLAREFLKSYDSNGFHWYCQHPVWLAVCGAEQNVQRVQDECVRDFFDTRYSYEFQGASFMEQMHCVTSLLALYPNAKNSRYHGTFHTHWHDFSHIREKFLNEVWAFDTLTFLQKHTLAQLKEIAKSFDYDDRRCVLRVFFNVAMILTCPEGTFTSIQDSTFNPLSSPLGDYVL